MTELPVRSESELNLISAVRALAAMQENDLICAALEREINEKQKRLQELNAICDECELDFVVARQNMVKALKLYEDRNGPWVSLYQATTRTRKALWTVCLKTDGNEEAILQASREYGTAVAQFHEYGTATLQVQNESNIAKAAHDEARKKFADAKFQRDTFAGDLEQLELRRHSLLTLPGELYDAMGRVTRASNVFTGTTSHEVAYSYCNTADLDLSRIEQA